MEYSKDLYMMGNLSSTSPSYDTNLRIYEYLKKFGDVFYVGSVRPNGTEIKAIKCAHTHKIITLDMVNSHIGIDLGCIFNNNDFVGSQPFLVKLTPMEFREPTREENLVSLAGQFDSLNTQIKALIKQRSEIGIKIKELL